MGMQSDILASQIRTTDGMLTDQAGDPIGRSRVRSVRVIPAAGAGSVVLKDGGAGGATKMTINTIASATSADYTLVPDQGLLFQSGIYVDVTTVASVMVFYS
jgi:hypothetical protein|tara:strand:+ start:305 stop:610 length:306 start_codon:yes stop_codon:yes gene_type:complete